MITNSVGTSCFMLYSFHEKAHILLCQNFVFNTSLLLTYSDLFSLYSSVFYLKHFRTSLRGGMAKLPEAAERVMDVIKNVETLIEGGGAYI